MVTYLMERIQTAVNNVNYIYLNAV